MPSLLDYIKEASPSNRNFDCAHVAIGDKDKKLVGTYVQGFYQLAQVQGLKCQVEAAAYKGLTEVDALKKNNPKLYKKL